MEFLVVSSIATSSDNSSSSGASIKSLLIADALEVDATGGVGSTGGVGVGAGNATTGEET